MPQSLTLYERLGGVYSIATVVDDLIDRVMGDPRLNANPRVDEAHHKVPPAGFKYLGHQILESCRRYRVMRFVRPRISVEPGIDHYPVEQILDHRRDVVDPAQPIIERRLLRYCVAARHILPSLIAAPALQKPTSSCA